MAKGDEIKTAIVVGKKYLGFISELAKLTGKTEPEVLKRALAMYRQIKLMEKEGYKPCMLKDRTARLLQEK